MYLSTAPYLSFAGAHLPRLKVPLPLHLLVGRRLSFATFRFLARHAEWTLREKADQNSFIKIARANGRKHDDLLETRQDRTAARAGRPRRLPHRRRGSLRRPATFRRLPSRLARWLRDSRLTQDIVIGHVQYLLARD